MRRFLASAFIIIIFPMIIPLFVKASSNITYDQFRDYFDEYFEVDNYTCTDYAIQKFLNYESGSMYAIVQKNESNNRYDLYYFDGYTISGNYISSRGTDAYLAGSVTSGDFSTGYNSGYMLNINKIVIFENKQEMIDTISDSGINFDDIYYSAQMPVPDIQVYMDSNNLTPSSGEAVWNATVELEDNSECYIQWGIKISYPTYITVGLGSFTGDYIYNYFSYVSGTYSDIVNMQSLTPAIAQGATASSFQSGWETTYSILANNPPQFEKAYNAMSNQMITQASQYYIDYMLTQMPMYGNRLEVFARYFIIDSENDNRVVVGAWNHWSSKDGSKTKERPTNYIDNVALPGTINSNSDITFNDNSDTYNTVGENTGTPTTVINNNYAPNYPDYPTVATYNHDNILLNFMDTAKQLPSFFGDFTGFLTVAFGFVPSWIWTLIGAGFTFSIVIMIIKVL